MKNYKVGDKVTLDNHYRNMKVIEVSVSKYNKPTYLHLTGEAHNHNGKVVWINATVNNDTGNVTDWNFNFDVDERTQEKIYKMFQEQVEKREKEGLAEVEAKAEADRITLLNETAYNLKEEAKERKQKLFYEINELIYKAKDLKTLLKGDRYRSMIAEYELLTSLIHFNNATQYLPTN